MDQVKEKKQKAIIEWLDEHADAEISERVRRRAIESIIEFYLDKDNEQMIKEISNFGHHKHKKLTKLLWMIKGGAFDGDKTLDSWKDRLFERDRDWLDAAEDEIISEKRSTNRATFQSDA